LQRKKKREGRKLQSIGKPTATFTQTDVTAEKERRNTNARSIDKHHSQG